ncbi:MAG: hypothetical protein HQ557_01055 [Bacteroidetes bacterium]|nr:hypothetical protein [Bacteroidota bacterium]
MDVEPLKLNPLWTGPEDKESSELYIKHYWDICTEYSFTPSFFIHPEAAVLHSELFTKYLNLGSTLGLHVHSTKFHYPDYTYEFGYYSAAVQEEIVLSASKEWERALGFKPLYFRPGAFSANDATASTLVKLGFRGGSLSIPGRVWTQRYCIWAGVPRYPHRVHPDFRCARGSLDFIDIPLSVDFSRPGSSKQYTCYEDLRPSGRKSSPQDILRGIIEQISRDNPKIPVLQVITHNDQSFENPSNESRKRLESTLQSINSICREYGFIPESSTIEKITDLALAMPLDSPGTWEQDNDVHF